MEEGTNCTLMRTDAAQSQMGKNGDGVLRVSKQRSKQDKENSFRKLMDDA